MFPASTTGGGMCIGFPDVCKVPGPPPTGFIPTPFADQASCANAMPTTCSLLVQIMNKPVLTIASEVPSSQGDEAGTMGGMISGTNMQKVVYRMGSVKVKIEGNPVVMACGMTAHNGANPNMPAGAQLVPSQAKVIIVA